MPGHAVRAGEASGPELGPPPIGGPKPTLAAAAAAALTVLALGQASALAHGDSFVRRTLDGRRKNLRNPTWGQAGCSTGAWRRRAMPTAGASPMAAPDRYARSRILNNVEPVLGERCE